MREYPYSPKVLWQGFDATKLAGVYNPGFFIRVDLATIGLIRGMLDYVADERLLNGTDTERQNAIDFLNKQMAEPLLTQSDICGPLEAWGAMFGADENILQEMQANGFPAPPWEFRIDIREGVYMLQFRTKEQP